jgi:CheY-like chemotaxis protein
MSPIRIYLIDDDPVFVFLTKKKISQTEVNTEVEEFGNGEIAINFIKEIISSEGDLPDLIFLDLNMPVLDGWGFLEQFEKLCPAAKKSATLYVVSSSISPHDLEKAKTFESVKDFIIKPLEKEKLLALFQSIQEQSIKN